MTFMCFPLLDIHPINLKHMLKHLVSISILWGRETHYLYSPVNEAVLIFCIVKATILTY